MASGLKFIDTTAETLYTRFIDNLSELTGEKMYEGDERLVYAQCLLHVIVGLFCSFNEGAKARLLKYAYGEILDAIGENKNCTRLAGVKATCTLRFSTSVVRATAITIPAGTRATADGITYFETTESAVISAGTLNTTAPARCIVGGHAYNGIPVGAITTLVDSVIGVTGVTNTTVTIGGDDGEPYPYDADKYPNGDDGAGDDRYRERIRLANSMYSTAGSEDSYIYWAKTASADITDVKVISDQTAGTVELIVMVAEGAPSETILNRVLAVCNGKSIRPLNDLVTVSAPTVLTYDIEINYTVLDGNQEKAIADINGDNGAIGRFATYTSAQLGRDINPDLLHYYCMQPSGDEKAGAVYSCSIVQPTARVLTARQLAQWSGNIILHDPTVIFEE